MAFLQFTAPMLQITQGIGMKPPLKNVKWSGGTTGAGTPQNGEMVDLEYQKIICIADYEHALVYEQAGD